MEISGFKNGGIGRKKPHNNEENQNQILSKNPFIKGDTRGTPEIL